MTAEAPKWTYQRPEEIQSRSLSIDVIADYGGRHAPDFAFTEVRNHFRRFDERGVVNEITETPVQAFSTLETGFWIGQEALHSEHPNLVIFSNTAPRGDIAWKGQKEQPFICALLDNGIPVFAVNAGWNLSFIKHRIVGMWRVNVPNIGTQFRSRDQYPEATMRILNGDISLLSEVLNPTDIPDIPQYRVASVDGYGNIKSTIRFSQITEEIRVFPVLRVTIGGKSNLVLNTLISGVQGKRTQKVGDLCMVDGSSGGKKDPFVEFIRLNGHAIDDWGIRDELIDDLEPITIEPAREILFFTGLSLPAGSTGISPDIPITPPTN